MKPHRAKAVAYLRSLEPDELDAYLAQLGLTDYEAYLVRLRYLHHRPLSAIAARPSEPSTASTTTSSAKVARRGPL